MAAKKLTDTKIRNTKTATEKVLSDGAGLYLRVRPSGKDWHFGYTFEGKRQKQGLGSYPEVGLEQARTRAEESRAILADGLDPRTTKERLKLDRVATEAAKAARHTVKTLFEEWHRKEASKRSDKGLEVRRAIEKDILPKLGNIYADEIRRGHIMAALDKVTERGSHRIANVLLQYLRQMFRHAALREIVGGDPTFGLNKKNVGGLESERDRFMPEDEIRELATKLPDSGLSYSAQASIWIMLSTCCRVGEVSRARWSDLDLRAGTWTIPAEHSKNGKEHLIHLSGFAIEHFKKLTGDQANKTWVLPSADGKNHLDTKTLQKQFRDRQTDIQLKGRSKQLGTLKLSGGRWTAHDLRRSGATLMGELGVRSDVIDRCLNHTNENKMMKVYQRQTLFPERQEAFQRLGERLALLARKDAGNVVALKVRKGAKR